VCSPQFYSATEQSVCKVAHSLSAVAAIPVISRPVSVLKQKGQNNRADMVKYDYMFSWVSALVTFVVMCVVTLAMGLSAGDHDRRELVRRVQEARRQHGDRFDVWVRAYVALLLAGSVVALFDAFWGNFDFQGRRSLANLVHIRDLDLYRVSGALFLLLLLAVYFLVWGAKSLALSRSSDRKLGKVGVGNEQ
jgi:hypothetical protein